MDQPVKKALYIGIYSSGTTSKMRADILHGLMPDWQFDVIDTDLPKKSLCRIWQSIGFRYKRGPLISKVNKYVLANIQADKYDLVWVDKAIYLTARTTSLIRKKAKLLIHFTPDPAFTFHRSKLFYDSLPLYDYAITTKSFEISNYQRLLSREKVLYATQGYDHKLHRPIVAFNKKSGICFLGHYEKEREIIIRKFIDNGIPVKLAGIKWENFVKQNAGNKPLTYLGQGVYGEEYAKVISSSYMSWGSVSKWIPEKHTTRTFEIPACGTALISERNSELAEFFNENEAIFYSSETELMNKVKYYLSNLPELETLSNLGHQRVVRDRRDYESIIKNILIQSGVIKG